MVESDFPSDRHDLYRSIRVIGACLFFVAVTIPGFSPPTRTLTIFLLASVFSIAAVYELSAREKSPRWMLFAVALLFALAGMASAGLAHFVPVRPEPRGPLVAANDAAPRTACGDRRPLGYANDLVMIFGKDRVIGRGQGPFTPIQVGTCPALTIRRVAGGLSINAYGYDSGDDVVYRIQDNEFHMVLRGFAKASRPDASTLIVSDDQNRETFFARYLNKNTLRIRGTFRCGDTNPVVIGNDGVAIGGRPTLRKACVILSARTPYAIAYSDHAP